MTDLWCLDRAVGLFSLSPPPSTSIVILIVIVFFLELIVLFLAAILVLLALVQSPQGTDQGQRQSGADDHATECAGERPENCLITILPVGGPNNAERRPQKSTERTMSTRFPEPETSP